MLALLRLHGLQLRRLLGLWGLGLIATLSLFHWRVSAPDLDSYAACACQLLVAPLSLIAALRGDLFAWILPVSRASRLASQFLFTLVFSILGALGTLTLLRAMGDPSALPLKIASLALSGLSATFILGALYLLIEESQGILIGLIFFGICALDIGITRWQLTQPFSPIGLFGLGSFAAVAATFYGIIYSQTEFGSEPPPTGFVPAPPQFPDNPGHFLRPTRRPETPELVWSNKPESREAKEVLGISKELRKGRSVAYILIRKDIWAYTLGFLFQFGFMFLFSFGSIMIQQFALNVTVQIGQSLKTWSYFAHTPLPRSKTLWIAMFPWLLYWVGMTTACLIQVPYSEATHFFYESVAEHVEDKDYRTYFRPNLEFGINDASLAGIGFPHDSAQWVQDPPEMAERLVRLLRDYHGVKSTPAELLALHPTPAPISLVNGKDPRQLAWLLAVEDHFKSQFLRSLARRRIYDCLLALLLSCWVLWGMLKIGTKGVYWKLSGSALAFFGYMIAANPVIRSPLFKVLDGVPWLTIPVLVGLIVLSVHVSFRAFRDWIPTTYRKPTLLKIR